MIVKGLTLAGLMAMSTVAMAADATATLSDTQGTVLVNQGEMFITAMPGTALQAGDRVMVMEGGNAILTYADGCQLPVTAGSLVTVAATTCAATVTEKVGPMFAQAVGDSAPVSGVAASSAAIDGVFLVAAGVWVASAASIVTADATPVSP